MEGKRPGRRTVPSLGSGEQALQSGPKRPQSDSSGAQATGRAAAGSGIAYGLADGAAVGAGGAPQGEYGCSSDEVQAPYE